MPTRQKGPPRLAQPHLQGQTRHPQVQPDHVRNHLEKGLQEGILEHICFKETKVPRGRGPCQKPYSISITEGS